MWRNVYRLPDGRYEFGQWFFDKVWLNYTLNSTPGAVRVGRVHEPARGLRDAEA